MFGVGDRGFTSMRVIAVGSGKGGTGKSVIAANLGLGLARRGVRTCLVDLDLGAADLHLVLGQFEVRRGLLEALGGCGLSLTDVMAPVTHQRDLHLVSGVGETLRPTALAPHEVERLAADVRRLPVDIVVLDLAAGVAQPVLDLFLAADVQLVVTTLDPVAIADAGRFLRLARLRRTAHAGGEGVPRPRVYSSLDDLVRDMNAIRAGGTAKDADGFAPQLILNRCRGGFDEARIELLETLRRTVGDTALLPLVAEIPEDSAVERATRLLAPVLDLSPASPASLALGEFADVVARRFGPPPAGMLTTGAFETVHA